LSQLGSCAPDYAVSSHSIAAHRREQELQGMDRMKKQKTAVARNSRKAALVYQDARQRSAKRVKDLMARMTLEEKAAQMMCVWQSKAETMLDAEGNFDLKKAKKSFRHGRGLGQVGRPSDAGGGKDARGMAELTNAIQKFFLENSRLGIPVMFHEECLHGHAAPAGTSFPQPIALGATGGGCGTRASMGPRGRDLWRGSISGVAIGNRGGARLPGRQKLPR
jgi:hypothetical protein